MTFNPDKQHTIAKSATISGNGLHSGVFANLTIQPAAVGFGIQFKRVDLPNQPVIKADCDLVTDTSRGTTLEANGGKISTVEHVLAALTASGIDNALLEIDGPEMPIIDGSSLPFLEIIEAAGIEEQDAVKQWYDIAEILNYKDSGRDVDITIIPDSQYRLTTLIDFNSKVLGTQHAQLDQLSDFKAEISPCRTFVFLHELEALLAHNLIKGGDLSNAIVVVDKQIDDEAKERLKKAFNKEDVDIDHSGYLNNTKLHFPNEPARHKLLDIIGDLTLSGFAIRGHVIAKRPGHAANIELAKLVKQYVKKVKNTIDVPKYDPAATPVFNYAQIEDTLPHRYPFLLVDKIIELGENHLVGVKNVTFNEQFFSGHFPGNPVMPGVLQIEALAQCGGILCINKMPPGKYDTYFLKIDNCKFKQMIRPGDTLLLKMEMNGPIRRGICDMHGTVYVAGKIAAEADLVAQLVRRPD